MHNTKNDLVKGKREKVIEHLNARLADVIDLKTQAKQAHWNVKGIHFIGLHELFDQAATEAEPLELGPAMVDDRHVHGPQDAVGNRRRPGYLEKMTTRTTAGVGGHARLPSFFACVELTDIERFRQVAAMDGTCV